MGRSTAITRQRINDVQAELACLATQLAPKNAATVTAAFLLITDLSIWFEREKREPRDDLRAFTARQW
jgi:hypothetical protein